MGIAGEYPSRECLEWFFPVKVMESPHLFVWTLRIVGALVLFVLGWCQERRVEN